jgi:photosystem II stability/assembly factor-like uncharacterized protein
MPRLRSPFLSSWLGFALLFVAAVPDAARAQQKQGFIGDSLPLRNIGPANMGGRIVSVAVVESKPATMYVAAASGGLWKTTDNGVSWTSVFDNTATNSLGDVAVAPSNPEIVWAGTGESNARNSVSWGDGVYKSTDGGKTWQNMGLGETHHIGRIAIHPTNPDIVYVAALGHLWGPNKERGIFKTIDGGKTWQQSLFLDEETGCIDVAMDPAEPDILYAAGYRVRRDAFAGGDPATQFGPKSGLFKTLDGGKTWEKAGGLPNRPLGRCGFSIYRKDPNIVYAIVQTDKTNISTVPGQAANQKTGPEAGGVFRSADRGKTWAHVNSLQPRPFYFGQIRVDPNDDKRVFVLGIQFHVSLDGGQSFSGGGKGGKGKGSPHPDHHALWIDPNNSKHMVLGNDGGLYFSDNGGTAWEHVRNLSIGQFYAVAVDMRKPYRVFGGLQDNGSWGGPSATRRPEGILLEDWFRILGGDGFQCQVDPTNPDVVYAEAQYGKLQRVDVRNSSNKAIAPRATKGMPAFRFNWSSPILVSPHNPQRIYYGGNHLFRSDSRGDAWQTVSPDLTLEPPGPSKSTGHTLTTIAESPLKEGLIYVGADDGRVHVTRDGGKTWTDLSANIPGVAAERWITRVECSNFAEGTAYLTIDRHRNDDRKPYLFKTTDHGATWQNLTNNLPDGAPLHVVRESSRNKDLLFAGTEFGLLTSLDGGKSWQKLHKGLPPVAVHDLVIHPRDRELVIGTHGRSIYIADVAPLEEFTDKVREVDVHLFDIRPATAFQYGPAGDSGPKAFVGANPPYGVSVYYYLKTPSKAAVSVVVAQGDVEIVNIQGAMAAGIQRVQWNLRNAERKLVTGEMTVTLRVGERTIVKKLRVDN